MKKLAAITLSILLLLVSACSAGGAPSSASPSSAVDSVLKNIPGLFDKNDLNDKTDASGATFLKLDNNAISAAGKGVTVNGNTALISAAGTYIVSGKLENGQIIVNASGIVRIVLNGADITCEKSAPIYVRSAKKTIVTLAPGSVNRLTDGTDYEYSDKAAEEPNATLFSKDDLTINGSGSLIISANFAHGISGKDGLAIVSGDISIVSSDDGLRGRDYIAIAGGNIAVDSSGDALKSTNDEDAAKGFVAIKGGNLALTSAQDGIQAETAVYISGGAIAVKTAGGHANSGSKRQGGKAKSSSTASDASAKGIKGITLVSISGGNINLDCSDDAVHTNGAFSMSGGSLSLLSADDGIHADASISQSGGEIVVGASYEGVESAEISVSGGNISITSSDDGINIAGGTDKAEAGRPQDRFAKSSGGLLNISGGSIYINANGDGIDTNGSVTMESGLLIIDGPVSDGNGALDYDSSFLVNGGTLIAAGSAGMAQAPSADSKQNSVMVSLGSSAKAGTIICIQNNNGEEIVVFAPKKHFSTFVYSSANLKSGETYQVYTGGSHSGTAQNGLYSGGSYTPGTLIYTFTQAAVTYIGQRSGGAFRPGGGIKPGGRPPQ